MEEQFVRFIIGPTSRGTAGVVEGATQVPARPLASCTSFCELQFPSLSLSKMRITDKGFARIKLHDGSKISKTELQNVDFLLVSEGARTQ